MQVTPLGSRAKSLCGATLALAGTLLMARVTSESWTLTLAGRFLAVSFGLPIVIMIVGLASCFVPPEILLVIWLLVALAWQIPIFWAAAVPTILAIGYTVILFRMGPKFFETPFPLRIYEFGADRIVPYNAWLFSPRRAGLCGVLCRILIGIATIWAAALWHAVDSPSART